MKERRNDDHRVTEEKKSAGEKERRATAAAATSKKDQATGKKSDKLSNSQSELVEHRGLESVKVAPYKVHTNTVSHAHKRLRTVSMYCIMEEKVVVATLTQTHALTYTTLHRQTE